MTSNDTNNNSTIDESLIGQPYKGPVKMVWNDKGQRIQVPDYSFDGSASNAANSPAFSSPSYVYQKELKDVLSEEDKARFKNLRTDEEKYDFVRGLIGGTVDTQEHHLWNPEIACFVHGERRPLEDVLQDLIDRKKLYMDLNGNLFLMSYAIQERMIKFPCAYCSVVLFSDQERRLHLWSHQMRR
jgi:hypothetical protein